MSEIQKHARLVLNTWMFYPNSLNSITTVGAMDSRMGYADANRANCTFTNLDWFMILGDLYNKYTTFSLVIESMTYIGAGGTPIFGTFNIMQLSATGLVWIDQTYDVYNKSKGSSCILYTGSYVPPNPMINIREGAIFRKPTTRYGDFTLNITSPTNGSQFAAGDRPAAYQYIMKIYGVDPV